MCTRRIYVIVQQCSKNFCKINVIFKSFGYYDQDVGHIAYSIAYMEKSFIIWQINVLNKLRNCISFIFGVRSLFCSVGDLRKSAFTTYSFGKLGYGVSVSVIFVLSVCSMLWTRCDLKRLKNVINYAGVRFIFYFHF